MTFSIFGRLAPKTGQKAQRRPKKRVLGITLARQNVFTCLFGFKNHFWGRPTVLEGLQTPTERSGPPLGPPPARPGRPGPGPKIFSVGGPGGPEKKFFPKNFFFSKTLFIGSWLGFGPKKLILGPSRPPTRGHFGPFYTQNGQNGIQKRPKNAFFS